MEKKLVLIRGFFSRPQELKQLLGSRLVSPSEAAAAMLSDLSSGDEVFDEVSNSDDFFVRVCITSEEGVVRALKALARHSGTSIFQIDVCA